MSDAGEAVRALLAADGSRIDAADFDGVGALFTRISVDLAGDLGRHLTTTFLRR